MLLLPIIIVHFLGEEPEAQESVGEVTMGSNTQSEVHSPTGKDSKEIRVWFVEQKKHIVKINCCLLVVLVIIKIVNAL